MNVREGLIPFHTIEENLWPAVLNLLRTSWSNGQGRTSLELSMHALETIFSSYHDKHSF